MLKRLINQQHFLQYGHVTSRRINPSLQSAASTSFTVVILWFNGHSLASGWGHIHAANVYSLTQI